MDRRIGSDTLSGQLPVVEVPHGPKKTLRAGLQATGNENKTMIIKSGSYSENLNIAGRNLKVFIEGKVDLRGNNRQASEIPLVITLPSQSNFVNSVTNR